jgi:hypothetical protein
VAVTAAATEIFGRIRTNDLGDEKTVEVEVRLQEIAQWVDGGWYLPGGTYTVASARHVGDREMVMMNFTFGPVYP